MLPAQITPKRSVGRPRKSASVPQPAALAKQPQAETYAADTQYLAPELAKFIKDNKLSTQMQGKEFVNVEGWQYAGSRLGIVPIVEALENCSTEQEIKYLAKVTLLHLSSQQTVGAGFAICSNKEGGRKFNQEFAIASMAQTRATGKAFRNILAWLVRAAGYEATPAEEMDYQAAPPAASSAAPASPNGAASRITAPAPVAEPTPAPAPVTPAASSTAPVAPVAQQPAMQVSRQQPYTSAGEAVAARNRQLKAEGTIMISDLQQALIAEMLQSPAISNSARNNTLLSYLSYTRERANTAIANLIAKIKEKKAALPENLIRKIGAITEEGQQLLKQPDRADAGAELRQFALTNAEHLGEAETERLISICGNSDWSAHQVRNEKQQGVQYLASQAAA